MLLGTTFTQHFAEVDINLQDWEILRQASFEIFTKNLKTRPYPTFTAQWFAINDQTFRKTRTENV